MTKNTELESKIKDFESSEEEVFENKEKLVKLYQFWVTDRCGEMIESKD